MNESLFYLLNGLAGQSLLLDTIIIFSAVQLPEIVFIAFGMHLFWHSYRHDRRYIVRIAPLLAAVCFVWVLAQGLKLLIASPRPFLVFSDVHLLVTHGNHDSFPSGHATLFSALGTAMFFQNKKIGVLLLVGAVIIGIARIIAGVHWPVDILGGFVLGTGVVTVFHFWVSKKKGSRAKVQ